MKIKTTIRHHYTPIRVAKIKIVTTPVVDKDAEKLELVYSAIGNIK